MKPTFGEHIRNGQDVKFQPILDLIELGRPSDDRTAQWEDDPDPSRGDRRRSGIAVQLVFWSKS